MSTAQVLPVFLPPTREDALRGVSRALLRIRSEGWTCDQLARQLDCSADTIKHASNEESLLSLDSVALLGFHFPEQFKMVEAVWSCRTPEPLTIADRVKRIERELTAIQKETRE